MRSERRWFALLGAAIFLFGFVAPAAPCVGTGAPCTKSCGGARRFGAWLPDAGSFVSK